MVLRLSAAALLQDGNVSDAPIYAMEWQPEWDAMLGSETAPQRPAMLVYVAADPVTWVVVTEWVIKAIVAEVAKGIAKKIIDAFGARTVREVLLQFFADLVAALRAELREQWLEETTADTTALKRMLEAYSRSPESRADHVPLLIVKAEDAFAHAERIGAPALGVASLIAAMRLAINAIQAKLSGTKGDWETCESAVQDFENYVTSIEPVVLSSAVSGITEVDHIHHRGSGGRSSRMDDPWDEWVFEVDGRKISRHTPELASAERDAIRAQRTADMLSRTMVPARSLVEQMQEALGVARSES